MAKEIFEGTGSHITTEGKKHLGVPLGSPSFVEDFVSCKVKEWTEEVESWLL